MRVIVLARHGRPVCDTRTPIAGREVAEWSKGRDEAPIDRGFPPPAELVRVAQSSGVVAASTLRRSLESAAAVAPGAPPVVDPEYREVSLPTEIHSGVRMRPKAWTTLARIAWYCGWSPGVENLAEARDRAALAATSLIELAAAHHSVLLTGHGMFNGLIGKQLRDAGWSGPRMRPRRYWAFAMYQIDAQRLTLPSRIP